MEISESQIIGRIQNGNLEEFGKLYDLYIKKIYDFIYYKTGHKQTAEDLTSQTFFKALKSINTFKISKIEKETGEKNNKILRDTNFSAWLYRIARNTVIDHHRTKKETKNLDELTDIFFEKDIDYDIDIQQKLEQVKKYLENF